MPKHQDQGYGVPKKERFVSTKRMINDQDGMGRILRHSGMFIVLIAWNAAEAFTRFIPSAIWVFIISGLLDALVNCLVIIFAAKIKGKNAWIWAAIIAGWNILSLLSHMLPINLWILIDIILDVIINILFLIFAPMVLFDKSSVPAAPVEAAPADKPAAISPSSSDKPASPQSRPEGAASRPSAISEAETKIPNDTPAGKISGDSVSDNPLERDAIKIAANLSETNRILAEQLQKQGGGEINAKLDSGNGGKENAG
jgi:hypothetical protein